MYSWGDSRYGRLGLGPNSEKLGSDSEKEGLEFHPREIEFFRGKKILKAACGGYHSIACVGTEERRGREGGGERRSPRRHQVIDEKGAEER